MRDVAARRIKAGGWGIVCLSAAGAALALLSTPVGLLEMLVASAGISELVPAAAPPLGMKAKLLLALFVALMAAGITAAARRDAPGASEHRPSGPKEQRRTNSATGANIMGFALSKLAALARGHGRFGDKDAPPLRRADAHPDAPSRAPIFASRDFHGLDIFARTEPGRREIVVEAEPEHDPVVPAAGLAMPSAPAALPDEALRVPGFNRRPAAEPVNDSHWHDAAPLPIGASPAAPVIAPAPEPLAQTPLAGPAPEPVAASAHANPMSVHELAERLERGLAARARTAGIRMPAPPRIADMPVAVAAPVRPAVTPEVDDALSAALGTLRSMAARAR